MPNALIYAAIALAMLLALRIITTPVRLALKLVLNTVCGFALLALFNLLSGLTGFELTLSLVSALIVGFLGLPGFGFLLFLRCLAL